MKNYALFSTAGRFIGFVNFQPPNGLYKEMPDNFDPVAQVYVGDYETGGLKYVSELQPKDYREANVDKKWKVFETELNHELKKTITENLGLAVHKQLNAIMSVLYQNRDKITLTPEFEEIYNTIEDIRHNHKNSLKVYEEAPKADVIHKDEEANFIEEYTQKMLNINEDLS